MEQKKADEIKKTVRQLYARAAKQHACCGPDVDEDRPGRSCSCASETGRAQRLYSAEELESIALDIPSLGCGNPIAISGLAGGETVLDLGSGGGLDCFLAAKQVGPQGRVIGLDMTPDMIALARANAEKLSPGNVEFRLGEMEHMPLQSESVDVVISNCVVNLSPDKDAVFSEAFRVLRRGGRLCVSDIVTRGPLPDRIRRSLEAWAGCVAGALEEEEYLQRISHAGFVQITAEEVELTADKMSEALRFWLPIASITVTAYKPA